jgi:hypothetical protein
LALIPSSPVLVVGVDAARPEERAKAFSVLRYAIIARLLLAPAPLHQLIEDLVMLREAGFLPPAFTLRDILEEVELYEALGLVYENDDGLLAVNTELLSDEEIVVRIENVLLGMADLISTGLPLPPRNMAAVA